MSAKTLILAALSVALAPFPASAQIFWSAPDLSSTPLLAPETGYGAPLPNANVAENGAAMLWALRSGLNVAALQCNFDPSLRILENYNAILNNHKDELASSFNGLSAYFKRTHKTPKAGQNAFDSYGTRTYSGFSSVSGQLAFCTVASKVSKSALFAPRGKLQTVAQERLRELYDSVKSRKGEQQFRQARLDRMPPLPFWEDRCWKKRTYTGKCGWQPRG
jgi:hypothetical protein